MTEATLQKKIKDSLNLQPNTHFEKIHGGQYSRGISDLVGVHRSIFCAFEVKLPGKEKNVTELQRKYLEKVKASGGVAAVVTSAKQALEIIDRIDRKLDGTSRKS